MTTLVGDIVDPRPTPRVATQNAADGQITALDRAVLFQCLQ